MRRQIAAVLLVLSACTNDPREPGISAPAPVATIPVGPYEPGHVYSGRNGYIEYLAGNAPVIFTAPHGGTELPDEIPDRVAAFCGGSVTTTTDVNTIELARSMQQRYFARFGRYPHVVVNHLARRKMDPNRTPLEAACGDREAQIALAEWHAFIDVAKSAALRESGKAWYMDMHGHGHAKQRLELGYLLDGAQLNVSDALLDGIVAYQDTASIRTISETSPLSFSALLRGSSSLGALYAANGFPSVPSDIDPRPNGDTYFSGGDDTRRHACGAEATAFGGKTGGMVCGVQIESNYTGVRDSAANRDRFGDVTAAVLERYLALHWGLVLAGK